MDDERGEPDLRHSPRGVLRQRIMIVVVVAALAVAAALVVDLHATRIYSASADVLLNIEQTPQSVFNNSPSNAVTDPARELDSQIQVMQSGSIDHTVRNAAKHPAKISSVSVSGVGQTDVMRVTVESPSPQVAHRAADLYASTYVTTQRQQAVNSLLATASQLQSKANTVSAQLNTTPAGPQHDALAAEFEGAAAVTERSPGRHASVQQAGAQVVDQGSVPTTPVKPQTVRDVALALVLGLLVGVGLTFLAEFLDDKTHTAADVSRYGRGLSVWPRFRPRRPAAAATAAGHASSPWRIRARRRPRCTARCGPACRSPRCASLQVLLVTSPASAEGKTTTVANLGVTLAHAGRRVVLVDLDLRRPRLAHFLGLHRDRRRDLGPRWRRPSPADTLQDVYVASGVPGCSYWRPGRCRHRTPPNCRRGPRETELLASLQRTGDLVIIELRPRCSRSDRRARARRARRRRAPRGRRRDERRRQLARAVDQLREADAPLLGAVLNRAVHGATRDDYAGTSTRLVTTCCGSPTRSRTDHARAQPCRPLRPTRRPTRRAASRGRPGSPAPHCREESTCLRQRTCCCRRPGDAWRSSGSSGRASPSSVGRPAWPRSTRRGCPLPCPTRTSADSCRPARRPSSWMPCSHSVGDTRCGS